jgi:subtilisin family serine protease
MRQNRKLRVFALLSLLFFSLNFQKSSSQVLLTPLPLVHNGFPEISRGISYAPDRILVKFKPSLPAGAAEVMIAAYQSPRWERIPRIGVYKLQTPENVSAEEMVAALERNPAVEYAELDYVASIALTPNDILFKYQYALSNSGQQIGPPGSPQGKASADTKATSAWEETKGSEDVVIAIIDTGVDLGHPDLQKKVKSSGRDFVNGDLDATDDHGHGTAIAGIAAAETNNNEGIAGMAWNCKILPVKVMDQEGSGLYDWIASGIIWAVDNGAQVINLSLGGDAASQTLRDAVKYAYDKNAAVVAATGNDGAAVYYPAAYDNYVLAVAATDYNDQRASWSNFGSEVDVAAPGDRIVTTVPTWYWGPGSIPYGFVTGTSAAAPYVSGTAALLKSIKSWLKAGQIYDIIRYAASDVNSAQYPGKDNFIGYGRLDAAKAVVPLKIK